MTNLDVFFEILRTFEALATHVARMGFERDMDSNVTRDMISFDSLGVAISPGTGQAQVVRRLASNVFLA
jgi:hypothetical protein